MTAKPKPQHKQTKKDRLAQQRLCKRRRYAEIKNDPELLAIAKEKRRERYLKAKAVKKIKSISEQPLRKQKEQRKKWRENSRRYRQNKEKKNLSSFQEIFVETNGVCDEDDKTNLIHYIKEESELQAKQVTAAAIKKIRYAELKKRKKLLDNIKEFKRRDKARCQQIQRLKKMLEKQTMLLDDQKKLLDEQRKEQIHKKPENLYIIIVK